MPGGDGVSEYTDETGDEGGLAGAVGLTGAGEAGDLVMQVNDKMWVRLGIGATKGGSNGWVDK